MSDSDTKLMFRSVLPEPIAPKGTFDLYVLSDSGQSIVYTHVDIRVPTAPRISLLVCRDWSLGVSNHDLSITHH